MRFLIIALIHLTAFLMPFADRQSPEQNVERSFPGWPSEFEGNVLTNLPLSSQEKGFTTGFPGKIARFSDGSREIIVRYLEQPSRQLHPSADCLRGSGYVVKPLPISRDLNGKLWGCVLAERDGIHYRVCERLYDQRENSWYDVSSWFWSVLLNKSPGPWWSITVAEKI